MLQFDKQETKGRATVTALFDAGTFVEMGAYVRRRGASEAYDAVITGYGSVGGKLAFAFVQDSDRTAGALDEIGADKIQKLYEQAMGVGAPVIGVFDSAGAVVYDGASALAAYGRVMSLVCGLGCHSPDRLRQRKLHRYGLHHHRYVRFHRGRR
jgi:propionyl-CoA carboxylase beta chain